jgi:hypothetical protein
MTTLLLSSLACACGGSVNASARDAGGLGDGTTGSDSNPDSESGDAQLSDAGDATSGDVEIPEDADSGADAPWSVVCPANPPAMGSSCDVPGVYCEYGNAWWSPDCDVVMNCNLPTGGNNPTWYQATPAGSGCLGQPGPNPSACPTNMATVQGSCPEAGLTCYYEQGDSCLCQALSDASSPTWGCFPGNSQCGTTRPRLGSPCSPNGLECIYLPCGYEQICMSMVWTPRMDNCQ